MFHCTCLLANDYPPCATSAWRCICMSTLANPYLQILAPSLRHVCWALGFGSCGVSFAVVTAAITGRSPNLPQFRCGGPCHVIYREEGNRSTAFQCGQPRHWRAHNTGRRVGPRGKRRGTCPRMCLKLCLCGLGAVFAARVPCGNRGLSCQQYDEVYLRPSAD
jgi:hypothetical protein